MTARLGFPLLGQVILQSKLNLTKQHSQNTTHAAEQRVFGNNEGDCDVIVHSSEDNEKKRRSESGRWSECTIRLDD